MEPKQIGYNLRFCRERLGYTQEEVGQYLGISQPAYNKYEKGETALSMPQLEKLAALYGVEEYDLLHGTSETLSIPLAFAFRKQGTASHLEGIAFFQTIVKNYLFICDELGKE